MLDMKFIRENADMLERLAGFDGETVGWTMMAFGAVGLVGNVVFLGDQGGYFVEVFFVGHGVSYFMSR